MNEFVSLLHDLGGCEMFLYVTRITKTADAREQGIVKCVVFYTARILMRIFFRVFVSACLRLSVSARVPL